MEPVPRIWLRPVDDSDAVRLYRWWIDPETQRFAYSPRRTTWDEHLAWLFSVLRDRARPHYIGEDLGGTAIGMMSVTTPSWVNIMVAPEQRGKGYGTALLRALPQEIPRPVFARVHGWNVASIRAFERAGFVADHDEGRWRIYRLS